MEADRPADDRGVVDQPPASLHQHRLHRLQVGEALVRHDSRTSGHSGSAGGNSGVQDGRGCRARFGGTISRFAVCQPALSTSTTKSLRPSGSAHRANSASASSIQSTFAAGRSSSKFRPLAGWTNP